MPDPKVSYQVNLSTKTILKIIIVILVLLFLYSIMQVLAIVFVAWVFASALDPLIDKMQRYKIPRSLSILSIYIALALLIILVFTLFIPAFSKEITNLTKDFPNYYQALTGILNSFKHSGSEFGILAGIENIIEGLSKSLANVSTGIYNAATGLVGAIVTIFAVLVITFYMTVEEEGIKNFVQSVTPVNYQPYIIQKINKIQSKLGYWLWGQIVLMIFIGILTAIALKIIGVKYALVLALFAGICEFIPIIGPIVAAIPAVLFSLIDFAEFPAKPLLVVIIYAVIQQIENHFLVPKIMHKAVGLNPIVVIITILIGTKVGGIIGVLLAVPAATIISIFLEDFFIIKKQEDNKLEGENYIKEQIKT